MPVERILNQLLNCGWDPHRTDPVLLRRVRTVSGTAFLLVLLGLPFLFRAYEWQIGVRMITVPAAIILALSSLFRLCLAKSFPISTQLVTLALYVAGAIFSSGGIGDAVVSWWLLVPLLAGLLRGLSSALGWGVLVLVSICGCYWAQQHGFPFPDLTPPEHRASQELLQALGITCALLILLNNYLSQIGQSERVLAQHNEQLSRQVQRAQTAEHELSLALASKNRFLANMSHELKTPLNAIMGFSAYLQRTLDQLSPRQEEALQRVVDQGQSMLTLVNDLLALARLDERPATGEFGQAVDLTDLLARIAHELAPQARAHGLELVVETDDSVVARVDSQQIQQAVASLTRHGLMFTRGDKVWLRLGRLPQGALFQVCYAGELNDEQKARLFDRFNHLHSQAGRDLGLSGLALPLAHEHVKRHGGCIKVGTDQEEGVCFNLFLPH
ncbi:MAG: hypothetical protein CML06_02400 [Pseudomonadales bacterium]|nr:hypothetical protein [Pseudomonadales bacterium]